MKKKKNIKQEDVEPVSWKINYPLEDKKYPSEFPGKPFQRAPIPELPELKKVIISEPIIPNPSEIKPIKKSSPPKLLTNMNFNYGGELVDFINKNKIKREDILTIVAKTEDDSDGYFSLFYYI